jgi:hypothetical protein
MNGKRTLSQWVGIMVILGFLFSGFESAANSFDRTRVTVQGASLAPLANGTPAAKVSTLAILRAPN